MLIVVTPPKKSNDLIKSGDENLELCGAERLPARLRTVLSNESLEPCSFWFIYKFWNLGVRVLPSLEVIRGPSRFGHRRSGGVRPTSVGGYSLGARRGGSGGVAGDEGHVAWIGVE